MTTIDSIVASSAVATPPTSTVRSPKQAMDGEMFLQLLVTQLRAQDPSSPMDTNAMMTQTTQLASMEQLTSLTKTSQENFALQMRMAAAGFIGKEVSYTDAKGDVQKGIATAVSYADSVPTVTVGGKPIRLDVISGVTAAS